jgi:MFS family permease
MLVLSSRNMFGDSAAYCVLFGLRILMGLAQAIHFPSLSSILSRKMNDSGRAFAMSFVCCGSQFGTLLTGYFGSKLLEKTNWKTVFVFAGILGVSFSVFMYWLERRTFKNRHRVINLTNLEAAPLMGGKTSRNRDINDFYGILNQISEAVKQTFDLAKILMKNK